MTFSSGWLLSNLWSTMWPARTARQQIRVTLIPQNLSKFYRSAIELTLDTGSPIHVYMNALFIINTAYKSCSRLRKERANAAIHHCVYNSAQKLLLSWEKYCCTNYRWSLFSSLSPKLLFCQKESCLIRSIDNKVAYQSNVQLISFLSLVPIYSIIDKQPLVQSLLVSPVYNNVN